MLDYNTILKGECSGGFVVVGRMPAKLLPGDLPEIQLTKEYLDRSGFVETAGLVLNLSELELSRPVTEHDVHVSVRIGKETIFRFIEDELNG